MIDGDLIVSFPGFDGGIKKLYIEFSSNSTVREVLHDMRANAENICPDDLYVMSLLNWISDENNLPYEMEFGSPESIAHHM